MTKYQRIGDIYEAALHAVTKSPDMWTAFLRSACRNYKTRFDEQILIYAQRPDATAVLEIEKWNRQFGRRVNRGAKGIAVFDDEHGENYLLKHYFDISDTHETEFSRTVPLWEMEPQYEAEVIESLENSFGELEEKTTLAAAIMSTAQNIVADNLPDYRSELMNCLDGSHLATLDELSVESVYHTALQSSVAYTILTRCGIDTNKYIDPDELQAVTRFNTWQTINALGIASGDISKMFLREISKTVLNLQKQEKNTNRTFAKDSEISDNIINKDERGFEDDRNIDISYGGRLYDSQPDPAGGSPDSPWQVRLAPEKLSETAPQNPVHKPADNGQAERAPDGNRKGRTEPLGANDSTDDSSRGHNGAAESQQPDGMGRQDEQHSAQRGGNDTARPDLHIKPFPQQRAQLKITGEAEETAKAESSAFSISQQIIDEVLTGGGNEENSIFRIISYFKKDHLPAENADFLKKEYGTGGTGFVFDGNHVSMWFNENGIHIAMGDTALNAENASLIPWEQAARRIRELLNLGRYAPQSDLDKADGIEINAIASHLWHLHHNLEDNAKFFMDEELFKGGFPDDTAKIAELLTQPDEQKSIFDGVKMLAAQYENDELLLRFRSSAQHLYKAVFGLADLQREPLVFTADESAYTARPGFITQDELDAVIATGGIVSQGKFRIYSYFMQEHTSKEKADFLKNEYGTGGFGRTGFNEWHDSKGLSYSRENNHMPYDKVLLPWSKVAKRIDELIGADAYLSQQDKEHYPQYLDDVENQKVLQQKDAFINSVASLPPAETRDTLSLRLADYINGMPSYEQKYFEKHGLTELADVTNTGQIDALLQTSEKIAQLITALTAIKGATSNSFVHRNAWRFGEELAELVTRQYDLQLGTTVYLGAEEFELNAFDENSVILKDANMPLYITEMPREEFDRKLKENPLNDELLKIMPAESATPESIVEEPVTEEMPHTIIPAWEQKKKPIRVDSFDAFPGIPMSERNNFKITDDNLGHGGAKTKFRANMDAINLLHELEFDGRLATPEEQETLSRYVGWGGLQEAFDESKPNWASELAELYTALSPEEYESAKATTLNAHYTSPTVIKAIYKAIENMGFKTGNILDPGCGIGNFQGLLPDSMVGSKLFGVEIDEISGRIARQLYQKNNIAIQGYENTNLPDSFFDLMIGNVPFGSFGVNDKRYDKHKFHIHDYFIAKTLDKVRPGGVMAFVTSKYTLDKQNPTVRKYIAQRAEFLGAIRLPNNAFLANAGTQATTDIIFLQKRDRMVDIEPDWVHLGKNEDGYAINSYFVEHPEMILGTMTEENGIRMYGNMKDVTCVPFPDRELSDLLDEAIPNIHAKITDFDHDEAEAEEENGIPADPNVRNFSYTVVDGQLYYRTNSRMHPQELPLTTANRVKGMIEIRECVRRLITCQTENHSDADIAEEQSNLNRLYDNYTKKYGILNERANNKAFADDESYPLLCSLEVLDENQKFKAKTAMFHKRTINPHIEITHVDTASEALAVSIAEKACVDLPFMSELSGISEENIVAELDGVIFRNVGNVGERKAYVTADEYLSGNIREKLQQAKAAQDAVNDGSFDINVTALEAAMPQDLTAPEISVRLGATWIPPEIYQQFIYELLDTYWHREDKIKVLYSTHTAEWSITGKSVDKGNIRAYSTYGTKRMNAYHIVENTLNLRTVRIFDTVRDADGKEKQVLNKQATAIAQDKQDIIKTQFSEWIWKDPERRESLCKLYNEQFNSIRPREYDGQHIKFHGMNPEISLDRHQVNAVARHLYGGNALFGHVVGAGKSFEMIAAGMESKRLGLCTKPMYVVPNNIIGDFTSDFFKLYPSANVLMATAKDFEKKNRKKFCARIATGEYDGVIIAHSQFEKIPMSIERQQQALERQIWEIIDGINEVKEQNGERFTIKQMERTRKTLEVKLRKLNDQSRKDNLVTFEELGVDEIFVDEADLFKNLYVITKMRNVGGVSQTESQKASDLFMKTQYLNEITGNRGVVFATGTPVSNSLAEVYTMQRYLQYDTLEKHGLQHFDCWASTFGETVTAMELTPEGTGFQMKTRFSSFYNLPELMAMFKEVADIQTKDMLNLPTPKVNFHTVVTKPSELQKEMIFGLAERAENIRNRAVDPSEDNMLLVTNDGRKIALDQRIINPMLPDYDESKVNTCVNNVFQIWEETKEKRLTQLVFSDLSTPNAKKPIEMVEIDGVWMAAEAPPFTNVYDDIKKKLIEKGIPIEEIAFIHDAKNEVQKKEIVAKVRSGAIRVLLGSTSKMGAGMNAQDKIIASHDLDCPWRPRDLEQRLGRTERRGNTNPEVDIYRYVTEGTFDAYCYQIIENKQRGISQVFTSKSPVRVMEEIDGVALKYAAVKALATGNPLIIERCSLEAEVNKLKMLKSSHLSQRYELEDNILKTYPAEIKRLTEWIAGHEKDIVTVAAHPKSTGDEFVGMTIAGRHITDKKEAGTAIIEACKTMTNPNPTPLGEYRSFPLDLFFDTFSKAYRIAIKGALTHTFDLSTDIYGNITRLDNVLDGLGTRLQTCREQLDTAKAQLETAKAEAEVPFSREQELTEKNARLAELTIALKLNTHDHEILDAEPDADEITSHLRSKAQSR